MFETLVLPTLKSINTRLVVFVHCSVVATAEATYSDLVDDSATLVYRFVGQQAVFPKYPVVDFSSHKSNLNIL